MGIFGRDRANDKSRKPAVPMNSPVNLSDPWGDKDSNISPTTVRGNKPADQVERERKTAMNAESAAKPKATVIPLKEPTTWRNDLD